MKFAVAFVRVLIVVALSALGNAQTSYFRLSGVTTSMNDGAVRIAQGAKEWSYIPGIGWSPEDLGAAPRIVDNDIYVDSTALDRLGIDEPRLERIRSSRSEMVRLVFDIQNLPNASTLQRLAQEGSLRAGETLELTLPYVRVPLDVTSGIPGIDVQVSEGLIRTNVSVTGPQMAYRVFSLEEPVRLVIDLQPASPLPSAPVAVSPATSPATVVSPAAVPTTLPASPTSPSEAAEAAFDQQDAASLPAGPIQETVQRLHAGVTHKRTFVQTSGGRSTVDVIEIAPGHGEFRVVGESFVPRTLSQLSSGGFAGINASYFDTRNHQTIGLLTVDHALMSLPSRNRASIGFGTDGALIDRIQAQLSVRVNGRHAFSGNLTQNQLAIHTAAGHLVGSPSKGALVVQHGRVLENRVGPRRVPADGFVLVYEPDIRELALVDTGDLLAYHAHFLPQAFNSVRYAVEAGPLLVYDGQNAYQPTLEAFDTVDPNSNVNRRTTRAAVGVRPDGTVLFVTATNMTAAELVPLFLSLGADRALQMDSGGSSTLFAAGNVVNKPASSQRPIPTAIVFIPFR